MWEGAPTAGCQQFAETTVRLQGWSRERRVIIMPHAQTHQSQPAGFVLDTPEDEVAVYVTNLERLRRNARAGGAALRATRRHGERV